MPTANYGKKRQLHIFIDNMTEFCVFQNPRLHLKEISEKKKAINDDLSLGYINKQFKQIMITNLFF